PAQTPDIGVMPRAVGTSDDDHAVINADSRAITQRMLQPAREPPVLSVRLQRQDRIEPELLPSFKDRGFEVTAADDKERPVADAAHLPAARLRQVGKSRMIDALALRTQCHKALLQLTAQDGYLTGVGRIGREIDRLNLARRIVIKLTRQ